MDQNDTQRFGVIRLKALDDEFEGYVVHVSESEASHVEDETLMECMLD